MSSPTEPARFLPVALNVEGKRCLLVGGGLVGTRKAGTLVETRAVVRVVSPEVTPRLAAEIEAGRVEWVCDSFREEHLEGCFLVIAATNDEGLNRSITELAAARGQLVCDASSAERSEVIFGALLWRPDATVAVFTDGHDPSHARRTRDEIAELLDAR